MKKIVTKLFIKKTMQYKQQILGTSLEKIILTILLKFQTNR